MTSEGTPPAAPALLGEIRLGELTTKTRDKYKQVESRPGLVAGALEDNYIEKYYFNKYHRTWNFFILH